MNTATTRHPNEEKFLDACRAVRAAWGLKTSTFDQVCRLIAGALSASLKPGVDPDLADLHFMAIWEEWTRWRATDFMLASPKEVSAMITKWPRGNHYHVTLRGNGVNITEKFNEQGDAQTFLNRETDGLKKRGYT